MICDNCNNHISGFIEDHICKGERVEKIKRHIALDGQFLKGSYVGVKESDLDRIEKENEELRKQIESMKCCRNCGLRKNCDIFKYCTSPVDCDKWELGGIL
jgi:hypothetical protein